MAAYRSWKDIQAGNDKPHPASRLIKFRYFGTSVLSTLTSGQLILLGTVCVSALLLLVVHGSLYELFLILVLAAVPMIALWFLFSHQAKKNRQDEQERIAQEKEDSCGYHNY